MSQKLQHNDGFTLIEVIVTIIVAAIMASMLMSVTGSMLRGSAESYIRTVNEHNVTSIADELVSNYRKRYMEDNDPIESIVTDIGTAGQTRTKNGITYTVIANKRITFTGSSGSFSAQDASSGRMRQVTIDVHGARLTFLLGS